MDKDLFTNLKKIIMAHKSHFAKAFLMVLISNLLLIVNPMLVRYAITKGASGKIFLWAAGLIAIALVSSYFKYHMRVQFVSLSRNVERAVRLQLFERMQEQSRAFYDRHGTGELLSRLTNDIASYRDVLGPGMMYPLYCLTMIVPGVAALFYISPSLAWIALIPLIVIPLLNRFVRKKVYGIATQLQSSLAEMSQMAQEYFSGIRIIKSYVSEHLVLQRFKQLCTFFAAAQVRLSTIQGIVYPFFTLLTRMVTVLLVVSAAYVVFKTSQNLTAADFLSFMWIQSYIYFPILMLAWILPIYERGRAAYDRLRDIYEEPLDVHENKNSSYGISPFKELSFHRLSFTYPGTTRPILSDFNLTVKPGEIIGITGPIGSGKTTLFRLLNREYEIPSGMIMVNGKDIHEYSLDAFPQAIATVDQVPFLFSKTIAENVLFGQKDATQADLETVSRFADLHETVLDFPDQYDTVVGERGVKLSGGQKQRVAIARALLINRSILLLDDVFSALDAGTENRIFEAIKTKFAGKTILLITHRISVLEKVGRVVYMKEGRVVEEGSPHELLKINGYYAALAALHKGDSK